MKNDESIRIFPLGDSALTVEFGAAISADLNLKAISLANHLNDHRFQGFIEAVPAYASTSVFYDLWEVRQSLPRPTTAFEAVRDLVSAALDSTYVNSAVTRRLVEIPVRFDAEAALDLEVIADVNGISIAEIIDIFIADTYRVYMLGFLPGFSYMGEVDDRIATPRKETPRTTVPKGSVGIAGRQTGIYSFASPGGWQIIGRTEIEMFAPDNDPPTILRPGDDVRFISAG